MRLIDLPRYGPVHRFGDYHVYRALIQLSDGRRKGRNALAESIGVGEGSIRTILKFLRGRDLVEVDQTGIKITKNGALLLGEIPLRMKRIERTDMSLGEVSVAVQVKGVADAIQNGIEQRDLAVKAGAEGATTVKVRGKRLLVPPDFDLDEEKPEEASFLRDLFELDEGDVIIVGTAMNFHDAENGALSAALDLL